MLLGKPTSLASAQIRMMIPVSLLSAFLNNTPIVALLVPLIFHWAKSGDTVHAQKLLIPLSFASIFGGTCTLIGTSTNLVVAGLQVSPASPFRHSSVSSSMHSYLLVPPVPSPFSSLLCPSWSPYLILPCGCVKRLHCMTRAVLQAVEAGQSKGWQGASGGLGQISIDWRSMGMSQPMQLAKIPSCLQCSSKARGGGVGLVAVSRYLPKRGHSSFL